MEELEKDLNKSCGCCPECNCGEECNCTPDNKCCDECTCDVNCNCNKDKDCACGDKCDCGDECKCTDNCSCGDDCTCGDDCHCDENNKCNENCTCEKDDSSCDCNEHCTCGENCECDEENKCCDECDYANEDVDNQPHEEEKCKCGCGESVEEESTADSYFKQLLSLRAEFDNYRKRTQNDISKAYSNGFNQAITEFLPALDSFKMATEYITDPNTLMGIQYIEKGILSTLEKIGVKVIDVSGKFDPNLHQAIGSEVSPDHESGDIIKECFKGFVMGDKVIRYSQVIVAK